MAGIAPVGGAPTLTSTQLSAEYQAKTLKLAQDATELQGDLALQLIESASSADGTGGRLNITI